MDKFKPVSGGGEIDHTEEAIGKLVVSGGHGAVDLEVTEPALNAVALLVERPPRDWVASLFLVSDYVGAKQVLGVA